MSENNNSSRQERIIDTSEIAERYARHPLATLETYQFFNQTSEVAVQSRQEFIDCVVSGKEMVAPKFDYPDITLDEMLHHRDTLTELLGEFPIHRELTALERITRENITNRLDEISIMLLTKIQSEMSTSDPEYERVSAQLGINMREVYGQPDKEHFRGILGYRLQQLAEGMTKHTDVPVEVANAWQFLQVRLPHNLPIDTPYQMRPETMAWYGAQLAKRMEPSREAIAATIAQGEVVVDDEGMVDALGLVWLTNDALHARGFSEWSAELSDKTNIDTLQATKKIYIPKNYRKNLDYVDQVILGHEIDQHVARRENGDSSGITELSGTGTHGYLGPEEGAGKVNEGMIKGRISNEDSAFGFFISGGLALGFDNTSRGRTMRETCELVWRINFVADYLSGASGGSDEDIRRSITKATLHMLRIYRGTDGRTPGVIFPKDTTTYYQGSVEVMRKWDRDMEMMTEEERRFEHQVERSAKINPGRRDHHAIAADNLRNNPYNVR